MPEQIVFVDDTGQPTGEVGDKLASHTDQTKLHLAFSCYVFNDQGRFLATKRAATKKVWPDVWSTSVCGHPAPGEAIEDAIKRRLEYELGMQATDIKVIVPNYRYKAPPYQGIVENEFCPIYVARAVSQPQPNPEEVAAYEWVDWQDFLQQVAGDMGNTYSWWCKDQVKRIGDQPLLQAYTTPKVEEL